MSRRFQAQLPAHVPGDRIAVHLQELQQLLGLLSIACLLLGREGVVGDQQGVGPTTCDSKEGLRPLSLKWFLQVRACIIVVIKAEIRITKALLSDARDTLTTTLR